MSIDATRWLRRARPLLGTLVEIGIHRSADDDPAALDAAFETVREAQACLSRFDPSSDVARFNAALHGERLTMRPATREVLAAAFELQAASGGDFDVTLGTASYGWRCEHDKLYKLADTAQFDLGGIGKGYAVDCAVQTLIASGCRGGWVNAGGDLRVFGDAELPLWLRDETGGGVRRFASLREGAFATSHFGQDARSRLACDSMRGRPQAYVSVAAPLCLWADALTKVVALSGDTSHPLLARFGAGAWLH